MVTVSVTVFELALRLIIDSVRLVGTCLRVRLISSLALGCGTSIVGEIVSLSVRKLCCLMRQVTGLLVM